MRRAVFLDRDGVLNRAPVLDGKPTSPHRPEELEILPGVREALAALRAAGYLLIVVTNQPDVARGLQKRAMVAAINRRLQQELPLDSVRVCYHDDPDGCPCRKPKPGMILQAAQDFDVDLRASFMVGDRWRDIEAGRRAGCRTVLIDYRYPGEPPVEADYRCGSLAEASAWILKKVGEKKHA